MDEKDLALEQLKKGPKPGSRYRHYKGGEYEIVANALDEPTLTHLIVYKNSEGILWVRTFDDWSSIVEIDGKSVKRFTRL